MVFQVGDDGHVAEHNRVAADGAIEPPYGGLYFTTDAPTTITTVDTYVKAAGVTAYSSPMQNQVDDGGGVSNRLRYTGPTELHFHAVAQASINFVSGNNQIAALQVWKYTAATGLGALVPHSKAIAIVPGQDVMQITTHCDLMMAQNDYIELHVADVDGISDIIVQEGYLFLMGMRRTL